MNQFDFPYSRAAQWGGILFLVGLWMLLAFVLGPLALSCIHYDYRPGTRRRVIDGDTALDAVAAGVHTSIPVAQPEVGNASLSNVPERTAGTEQPQQTAPPAEQPVEQPNCQVQAARPVIPLIDFPPVIMAFKDIEYTIRTRDGSDRKLLQGVTGWAKPGSLTALMGASGAGKTTLLDVLAFRKTLGKVEGKMELNGKEVNQAIISRVTAYCEQEDIHMPTTTVYEALEFSFRLRAPAGVDDKVRKSFLQRIIRVLELDVLQKRLVGTLSKSELKRVTIGVELASCPSCLFVDEVRHCNEARRTCGKLWVNGTPISVAAYHWIR